MLGLRAVAEKQYLILDELEKSAREITGENNDMGHTLDFICGHRNLDEMLDILKIKVIK